MRGLFVTSFLRPRPWGLCGKLRLLGKEEKDQTCVWHSAGIEQCTQNEHSPVFFPWTPGVGFGMLLLRISTYLLSGLLCWGRVAGVPQGLWGRNLRVFLGHQCSSILGCLPVRASRPQMLLFSLVTLSLGPGLGVRSTGLHCA